MTLSSEALGAAVVSLFGGGGLGAWLAARAKGKVDLVTVAQNAAKEVIASLQQQIDRQDARIDELEGDVKRLREERHALGNEVMAERKLRGAAEARATAAEARCEALEGETRQLGQRIDSLQRQLERAGIPVDPPGQRETVSAPAVKG